jgi:hypothetical protein
MWDTSEFFKQLPEVNIDPLGENLVTWRPFKSVIFPYTLIGDKSINIKSITLKIKETNVL